jgi:hypothetical protein
MFALTAAGNKTARRSGPSLLVTYRWCWFAGAAPWDLCRHCRESDFAGRVSDRRLAGRVSDPAPDSAAPACFGSSCHFPFMGTSQQRPRVRVVPIKEKWQYATRRLRRCYSVQAPPVPISSYEHTRTAQRTSGNCRFGATIASRTLGSLYPLSGRRALRSENTFRDYRPR